jgi:hypothetical protein
MYNNDLCVDNVDLAERCQQNRTEPQSEKLKPNVDFRLGFLPEHEHFKYNTSMPKNTRST